MKTPNMTALIPTSMVPNIEKNGATKEKARPTRRLHPSSTMNVRWRRMVRAEVMRRCMAERAFLRPHAAAGEGKFRADQ